MACRAEVIDARFINPLNHGPLVGSIKKTGKVVLASDACERGSFHAHHGVEPDAASPSTTWTAPPVVVGAATGSRRRPSWKTCSSRPRSGSSTPSTSASCRCRGTNRRRQGTTRFCAGTGWVSRAKGAGQTTSETKAALISAAFVVSLP